MKKYTEKVRAGLRTIQSSMSLFAQDKRDEKDPKYKEIEAALDWIEAQEQRAKRAAQKRTPNSELRGD